MPMTVGVPERAGIGVEPDRGFLGRFPDEQDWFARAGKPAWPDVARREGAV